MPYVYTGKDSMLIGKDSKTQFQNKIESGACPGGWDRISGKSVYSWYKGDEKEGRPPYSTQIKNLAGIDYSNYVSRCWQITTHSTKVLPNICVQINKKSLKAGDILDWPGAHVRIFNRWVGAEVEVYEATGGMKRGEFTPEDKIGRVVTHTIDPEWDKGYIPYSIFPQFQLLEPLGTIIHRARPTFQIYVFGSGDLDLKNYIFDGKSVVPQTRDWPGSMQLIYTPNHDLPLGRHFLFIEAINHVAGQSFQDEFRCRWQFVYPELAAVY